MNPLVPMIASTVVAATPLIYAALGETIVERSGVLNLGIEGMMLIGAVAGFAATRGSGSDAVGFIAAAAAGVALSLVFGFLTLNLQTNQVATGLAMYGYRDTASRIADATVANALKFGISEHYSSATGAPLGVSGLGMSATTLTMILDRLTSQRYRMYVRETRG